MSRARAGIPSSLSRWNSLFLSTKYPIRNTYHEILERSHAISFTLLKNPLNKVKSSVQLDDYWVVTSIEKLRTI